MSIPLKARKVIKEAVAGFQEKLAEASQIVGTTLNWEDQSTELYNAVVAAGGDGESLKHLPEYGQYLIDAVKEVATDECGKEALANAFNVTGTIKFWIRTKDDSLGDYFKWDDQAFLIEVRPDALGYWGGYYSADAIKKKATCVWNGHRVGLQQKKKLQEVEPKIQEQMKKVSDAYGTELKWEPDYSKLWSWLVEYEDPQASSDNLGNTVLLYVEFFVEQFMKFIEDPDNKEAMQEKLTANKLGFRYLPKDNPNYVNWAWGDDGSLLMDVTGGAFGYWITESYYSQSNLEATF